MFGIINIFNRLIRILVAIVMKFIADSMLGKLTRWLRMSGYDVVYSRSFDDEKLVEVAVSEKRHLLSRDKTLIKNARKRGVSAIFMNSCNIEGQLKQLVVEFGIILYDSPERSRCPMCNHEIAEVKKEDVRLLVPEKVFLHLERFRQCTGCKKVYWQGGHWERIKKVIGDVRGI